ncbi:hypothetical protein [Lactococcus lactis]|uniref:hypothetical protein n=1 Tax=Lactococcus lactis TaxID=1358 RepID=UPI0011244968|nr:hypothetical protein [Lactococcus lactis]TNU79007.1 hypothetical protein FIB48_08270 [Lactococcus lactis subsp. lactis]
MQNKTQIMEKVQVSDYFHLGLSQSQLEFVDVRLDTDIPLFIDPSALKVMNTDWSRNCQKLISSYFRLVLESIRNGNQEKAKSLLVELSEPNETHFGHSMNQSQGKGMGEIRAIKIWEALSNSLAVKTGLIKDLEDTVLMIDGIGPDLISDIVTNIIREPLIQYTRLMCEKYNIPMTEFRSGKLWNPDTERWERKVLPQVVASATGNPKPLLLVPRVLVRESITYNAEEFNSKYLYEKIQNECYAEGLVRTIKNGDTRPIFKKTIKEKFAGQSVKEQNINLTIDRKDVLEQYKSNKDKYPLSTLSNEELTKILDKTRD